MAREMTDISLDESEDLLISSGDFIVNECTAQHQRQLVLNNSGDFKQNPTVSVGIVDYLDDENYQDLMRKISLEFIKDGMDVKSVTLDATGVIKTDAYYQ
ncbi:MAG: uncharacterized protein JWQ38_190 [Flavipsychrobacter sp.]|nr:uncharacterized protein [Flavipsychrobacter sp.]